MVLAGHSVERFGVGITYMFLAAVLSVTSVLVLPPNHYVQNFKEESPYKPESWSSK
jgi:hypothetical protein